MSEIRAISHHIGGEYWSGQSDRTGDVYNPATGKITGKVDFASVSVIDHAVDVATRAQQEWRNASIAKRVQVLSAFREIVNARKEENFNHGDKTNKKELKYHNARLSKSSAFYRALYGRFREIICHHYRFHQSHLNQYLPQQDRGLQVP